MPSKKPNTCPICHRPGLINLSQHLNSVHRISGQERKQLIRRGIVGSEVMVMEPQSHIEKHIQLSQNASTWRAIENRTAMKKATQGELKAILELCLNMNEGNLSLPKRKSHPSVVSSLANKDIPFSNKKRWMLKYNKMLYNIIHPAMKEWKRKFRRV